MPTITTPPTVTGTVAGQTTTSEASVEPFSGVTITDANSGATDTLTITVGGTGGTLTGTGLSGGAGGVYTLSGAAASVTSEIDTLSFTPTAGTPNTSSTSTFTLSDKSSAYATATVNRTTTVIDSDPAVAPTIAGTHTTDTTSQALVHPFSGVTVADANHGASETLTITVGGTGGTLTGTGLSGGAGGVYTLSGSAASVTSYLDALSFKATGTPNMSSTSTFTLSDKSSAYATPAVDAATTVINSDPAVAPAITGTKAGQNTISEATVAPFSSVRIGDANSGATDILTITVGGTGGTLTGTGLSGGAGGVYTLSGSAASVTSELDALLFKATAGTPNTSSTSTFTLSDQSSAYATPAVDTATTVIDRDPAVAPTITETKPGQTTTSEAAVTPFSSVTIADANSGATDILTITVAGTGGTLTGTGLSGGAGGVYTLSGAAASVTSDLDALSFTPTAGAPNTSSTSTFTLSDQSSAYATATVNRTTTVIDSDPAVAPTIAGTHTTDTTSQALVHPFSGVTIADANHGGSEMLTITVGGTGGTLTGTGLSGGTGGVYTLSGSAASVTSNLDALLFKATAGTPNTSSTSTFTLSDQSAYANPTVDSATTVIDSDPAVAPTITGTKAGQTTTSEAAITPFSSVTIADANSGATDILTITVGGTGGTLNGTGLSGGAGGVYTLSGAAASVTSYLDALSFTPTAGAPNTSSTSTFTLSDQSSAYATATVNRTTTVIDSDPAVAPTIAGTHTTVTTSQALVHPFSGVTIADANHGGSEMLTITVGGTGGTLTGTGLSGGTGGVYSLSGSAASVTSDLDALSFKATGTPNTSSTSTFTLSDKSSAYTTPTVDTATTVIDSDPAVAPAITGTKAGQTTTSEAAITPFSSVTIADANSGATDILTITVGGTGGTLTGTGLSGGAGGVYTLSGAAASVTSDLDALSFKATAGTPNTSSTSTFTLSDQSSAYATATVNRTTTVVDSDPAVAPTIAGTHTTDTTSQALVHPFSGVIIADASHGGSEMLTITVGGTGGTLTGTGLSGGAGGVYLLSGSAASVTSDLDALSFKATGTPNTSSTSTFTLSDKSSTYATPTVDTATTVINSDAVVAPPTITGAVAGQGTTSEAPVTPFSGVTIGDTNSGATDILTIAVGGTDGALTDGAGFKGLSGGMGGVYTLSGPAAAVTAELDALSFAPAAGAPNTSSTSSFTLSDTSSAYGTVTVNGTTSVIDTDPAVAPTITGTVAGQTTTSETPVTPFLGVTIADANHGASETLTITVGGTGGTLTGTGSSGGAGGVYMLSGTASSVTIDLDALSFTPTAGMPDTSSTSTFTLSDQSSASATATADSATSVIDSDPASAPPTITGTVAGQTTTSEAPVTPFSDVTIGDPNVGATDTLTITVGGTGGTLTGTGLSVGAGGVYTLSGPASIVTTDLDALSFTPAVGAPNTSSTSTFTLSDRSSAYGTVTFNSTPTTLWSFTGGADGANPYGGLISDAMGDLFGTTFYGGANGVGAVFEIANTSTGYGAPTTLWSFTGGTDGSDPYGGLISDATGDLFGTTFYGGANGDGAVFEIADTGTGYSAPTTLWSFTGGTDGGNPYASPISDAAGDLFGTTYDGGAHGAGAVFEIAKTGSGYSAPTTLWSFTGGTDGGYPYGVLISDAAGDLFGTTYDGGTHGDGTVFEIAKTGTGYSALTTLWSFNSGTDGGYPVAGLISDAAGDLFGTTADGGTYSDGTVFEIAKTGTGYSAPATLWSFTDGADGANPYGGLISDGAGDLFGTTVAGGANGYGTAFEIAKTGTAYSAPTILASFNGADGAYSYAGLISDAAGDLFAMTVGGGTNGYGTVFEIAGIAANPTVDTTTTVIDSDPAIASPAVSTALLEQAVASFGGSAAVNSAPGAVLGGADMSQPPLLTSPQHS